MTAAGGVSLLWCAGCAVTRPAVWHDDAYPLPAISHAAPGAVVDAAERVAAQREGDFVLTGEGVSMMPVFRPGTALVVHPTSYAMLKRGATVVYQNGRGGYVAHVASHSTARGWVVVGLNNLEPDAERVTPANLIGVVRHAVVPVTGELVAGWHVAAVRN